MRKWIAIFCLLAFGLYNLSGLLTLASFYSQRDYIAQNLCINRFDKIPICKGQCYLEKQIQKNNEQQKDFSDLKQKEIQLFELCNVLSLNLPKVRFINPAPIWLDKQFVLSDFNTPIFHPPKVG